MKRPETADEKAVRIMFAGLHNEAASLRRELADTKEDLRRTRIENAERKELLGRIALNYRWWRPLYHCLWKEAVRLSGGGPR